MSALTPALRDEIERLLHTSDPAFNHGEVLRSIEQGSTVEQIAANHRRSVAVVEAYMKSVQHVLVGTIPASKSAATTNAAAYRELLARDPSPELQCYADERLQRLIAINPDTARPTSAPARTRRPAAPKPAARPEPTRDQMCPDCFAIHAGDCY